MKLGVFHAPEMSGNPANNNVGSYSGSPPPDLSLSISLADKIMQHLIDHLFVGPIWPASVLAAICLFYILLSLIGIIDLGLDADIGPDIDIDLDPDLDLSPDLDAGLDGGAEPMSTDLTGGIGAATLKAVNLDRVPLMLWLAIFAMFFWLVSYFLWFQFDSQRHAPTLIPSLLLIVRNAVIAVVATKFTTKPLHALLIPPKQYHARSLVGGTAVVETIEVDGEFGRAKYPTNGAPLLISVITYGEPIPKGSTVHIVSYDEAADLYTVEADSAV